jgi:hypothetical protein
LALPSIGTLPIDGKTGKICHLYLKKEKKSKKYFENKSVNFSKHQHENK